MGSLIGHVTPGFGFLILGLWHLFNHIRLHTLHPNTYTSSLWFPTSTFRYLELFLIIGSCFISILVELFIGPERHQPFDPDGTIPSNHLHNFEHSSISMSFLIYAAFAYFFDRIRPRAHHGLTHLLAALAFAQQLLLFHFHSADHMAVEGQYHLLFEIVILITLTTTLMAIKLPNSFFVSFVRSTCIMFQGLWLILMGFMLWTPALVPKGCTMNREEGHHVVRCNGDRALHRAKSLVNLQFSCFLTLVAIFSMSLYLILVKRYSGLDEKMYWSLGKEEEEDEEDMELQKIGKLGDDRNSKVDNIER